MGIESSILEDPNMRPIEQGLENDKFRYQLFNLYEGASSIKDDETKEMALNFCDDLRRQSLEYLEYVSKFLEHSRDPNLDFTRGVSHEAIISNLDIITRTIGGDYHKWLYDSASDGGLDLNNGRKQVGKWALKEALIYLKWQLRREEAGYESEGNTADAA